MRTRSQLGDEIHKEENLVALPVLPPRSHKKRKKPTGEISDDTEPSDRLDVSDKIQAADNMRMQDGAHAIDNETGAVTTESTNETSAEMTERNTSVAVDTTSHNEADAGLRSPQKTWAKDASPTALFEKHLKSASKSSTKPKKKVREAPRGRCVSGRIWKAPKQSQKASMQVTKGTETLSTTWEKKLEIRAKRRAIVAMEREMRDRKRQEIEAKKEERLDRERRRQQNEMKNTTYQTIMKTHKLKTMSKKQLRQIKKRQINARTGEVEFVSPWGGNNSSNKKSKRK